MLTRYCLILLIVSTIPLMANEMGTSEGYITTEDGVRLFFRRIGASPKAVIVPNGFYFYDDFARFAATRSLVFYDVRNRGHSDPVSDPEKLARGIAHDVDDLDAVRRHFELEQVDLIGHSYIGLMVGLYAMKYSNHVDRVVQIGPIPYDAGKKYPAEFTNEDGVLAETLNSLAGLQKEMIKDDPEQRCKKFWGVLRRIYVYDTAYAERIDWGRCELANERNSLRYWTEMILPSIQKLKVTSDDFAEAKASFLILHGNKDRSSAYGGGRDWAMMLPNARLLTIENVAHAPWIEAPDKVFPAIETFLGGEWPPDAKEVH